jgi:hypothetical protein
LGLGLVLACFCGVTVSVASDNAYNLFEIFLTAAASLLALLSADSISLRVGAVGFRAFLPFSSPSHDDGNWFKL